MEATEVWGDVCRDRTGVTYEALVQDVIEKMNRAFVGREQQIRTLVGLLGQREDPVLPLMVCGPPASGKTAVVRAIACGLRLPHALVDCGAQCVSQNLLFEDILARLQPQLPSTVSCTTPAAFVSSLRALCKDRTETTYLILDQAERLRESIRLLQMLLRIDEITGCNIGVILISSIVWDKFLTKAGLRVPIPILFPRYSRSELIAICSRHCPPEEKELFEGIVMVVVDYVAKACTDLNEVRRIVLHFLTRFSDPLFTSGIGKEGTGRLLQTLKPHLAEVWQKLFVGLPSETDEEERLDFELAGYAKYLVLAGYLASYNDPRYDVDYFSTKIVGKAKKGGGRKFVQLKEDPNLRLLGPRDFPIDRMLAIFSSIAAGKEVSFGKIDTGDHNIYHQVSTLVSLGFFIRISSEESLETTRLKCNVSHEFVRTLAANLSFELDKYVHNS